MILSVVIFSIISGGAVSAIGYPKPFLIAAPIFAAVGAGMMSTFTVDMDTGRWIGYQIVFGIGVGLGLQQPVIVVQAALSQADVAIGTAIVVFAQTLGGAIFICIAQNIFQRELHSTVASAGIPALDPATIASVGATQIRSLVPAEFLPIVLVAYNNATTCTFDVSIAAACVAFFGALICPWISVKGKNMNAIV